MEQKNVIFGIRISDLDPYCTGRINYFGLKTTLSQGHLIILEGK
jgi:hypothetical protein